MNKQNIVRLQSLKNLTPKAFSAFKFYEGDTDNDFLPSNLFDEKTRKESKAYITINTLMQDNSTEEKIFKEGKKLLPELITPEGVKKLLELYKTIYCFSNVIQDDTDQKLCAFKRCSELNGSCLNSFTSVTKLSPEEIYKQGYGNKVDLAVCYYRLQKGARIFDFEQLGDLYKKKKEREVLLMIGNEIKVKPLGIDQNYLGNDNKPAKVYEICVSAPKFDKLVVESSIFQEQKIKNFIFNKTYLEIVRNVYKTINENIGDTFPSIPKEYWKWKYYFQQTVYRLLKNTFLSSNY